MAARIIISGDLSGEYLVDEALADGRLVIRPDTTAAAIRRRQGLERISSAEFERRFGTLPSDSEHR